MTGSCPVSAHVCQETARERDELRRWKAEALPVSEGLQELGKALGLPLGSRITGQEALAAVERLTRERDEARAEVKRLRAGIAALADWHETKGEKADRYSGPGRVNRVAMSKAATVHRDASRRLLDLLNPTEGDRDE